MLSGPDAKPIASRPFSSPVLPDFFRCRDVVLPLTTWNGGCGDENAARLTRVSPRMAPVLFLFVFGL